MIRTTMLLLLLAISSLAWGQYTQVDFEPAGTGASWAWTVGEDGDNPPLEFVANPAPSGANTSATVAQFSARTGGQAWALCYTDDIEPFQFNQSNATITIKVYKTALSNVGIKFEGSSAAAEVDIANTQVNQWETITFDFSAFIGNTYSRLIIIPDFVARPADRLVYFDSIQIPEGNVAPVAEPTTNAPTPTYAADNVISLFSNAYTNVPVDTWSASWDMADVSDIQIDGNDVKRYTGLTYAGIEFTSNTIDARDMEYFHMDVWTPDDTAAPATFKVKLVDFGADGAWSGGDDVEYELSFDHTVMSSNTWVSLDIPLSSFTGLTTRQHLAQLIISGDLSTVYVDNVYFRGAGSTQPTPTVAAPTPAYNATNVISLFSDAYTSVPVDTWSASWDMANVSDVQINGNNAKLYTDMTYAGVEFTTNTIDATNMSRFHVDIWTPQAIADTTEFKVKLVDFGADGAWSGGDDVESELTFDHNTLISQSWIQLDLPLTYFTALTTRQHLAQLVISGDLTTVYVDNVFFHNNAQAAHDNGLTSPALCRLEGNYPNPFNPVTAIKYNLASPQKVSLKVFDARGRLVDTLVNSRQEAGDHQVVWNAGSAASGVYFYTLSAGNGPTQTKRMVLIK